MGFKFFRVDLTGGSTDFPVGTTDALRRSRAETILKKIVEGIIASNCGWVLDTNRNATITDFADVPSIGNSVTFPGLFLNNSVSGCKMFISYFGGQPTYHSIKDFSGTGNDIIRVNSGNGRWTSGVCVSIIPDGSSSTFGASFDASFLPSDATRIVGTFNLYGGDSDNCTYGGGPTGGRNYSWGIFINEYVISITANYSDVGLSNLGMPVFAAGRIFGTLAHSNDTTPQAKYGVVKFNSSSGGNTDEEGRQGYITNNNGYFYGSSGATVWGHNPYSSSFDTYYNYYSSMGCISRADGTWINGSDQSSFVVNMFPVSPEQLSGKLYNNTNGKSRWIPYAMMCLANDLSTNGIVDGDGFKGYIDTDLFRCARGTYCQTFDNGNFACIDQINNVLIGWDTNNTDSLAG